MFRTANTLKYYGILTLAYIALVIILPANRVAQQNYHLSAMEYHILLFVVILPLIAIWFAAFYGYAKVAEYTRLIAKTPEGDSFKDLTRGFMWLAWGLGLASVLSILLNSIANSKPSFHGTALIITNYTTLATSLIAYSYIFKASRSLSSIAKIRASSIGNRMLVLLLMFLAVLYCYFTFRRLDLNHLTSSNNPYYLPVWLMLLTVVLPSLYAWFIGLVAAYEINLYSRNVKGLLYGRAMRLLSFGVAAVTASSVMIQFLHSAVPRTGHLSLNVILILINVIYVFMAIGYVSLSFGSSRLKRIEEV